MVNVIVHTTLNLFQNPMAQVAITHDNDWMRVLKNNPSSSSQIFDAGKLPSSLPQSSEAAPPTNDHTYTKNEFRGDSNPLSDAFFTPPDSPFTLPSENVDLEPPNTLNSVTPFSVAISPFDPLQTPCIPSSGGMLSDSLGVLPTQHSGPTNTDDVYSDLLNDLTDHVTRSDSHPFTSGGFGDIYRGDLDAAGRLINVSHHSFLSGKLNKH